MDSDPAPGAHDPASLFTASAESYAQHRPGYPDAALRRAIAGLGAPGSLLAADVGAGTGIAARQLADLGPRVLAIEPNAAMRAAAAPHPRIEWRDGTAEATGLAGAAVDLVLCAQAFHWFRAAEALAEFRRVLRRPGRLALIWNTRDVRDAFTRGYVEALRAVGGESTVEMRGFDPAVIHAGGAFAPATLEAYANAQRLDAAGLLGRALSASYAPREGERGERLRAALAALHERYREADGRVALRYVTKLYVAESR
ncbi:MAG TPA: class I SAM-dependent methyltransferase [Candidatus Eisenbacteria bacterium]|nr:class I SAM-dependent methyltransferase [Candidatus Eisenbacteria bacterium]